METDLSSWTVEQLKDYLRERGLPLSGNKKILIRRLEESDIKPVSPRKTTTKIIQDFPKGNIPPIRFLVDFPSELNFVFFLNLDDEDLAKACRTNKEAASICTDDLFWKERIIRIFGYDLKKYKEEELSYRKMYKFFKREKNRNINDKAIRAAWLGYLPVVKFLIKEKGADPHVKGGSKGYEEMLLTNAIIQEYSRVITYLVEKVGGYDLNFALIKATEFRKFEIIKYLIEKGADIYFEHPGSQFNDSAFSYAVHLGYLDIFKYMIQHEEPDDDNLDKALAIAAGTGNLPILKDLVEKQVATNINELFIHAAEGGHLNVIIYLVEIGGDIHINDDDVLLMAARNEYWDILKYIVEEQGATNIDGALIHAADEGNLDVVRYLVENGADIHVNDNESLRLAELQRHDDIVRYIKSLKKKRTSS